MEFSLQYTAKTSKARAATILTNHGAIQTPIFMPVGTGATVKAVHQRELQNDINAQIILGNAYHLYLRPGTDLLVKAGGLHKFMNWERPILTDSGGYQIFSLTQNRKLKEEGAHFASHIDGSKHLFTPEKVIEIQRQIGSDIMMSFDECPPYPATYEYVKKSMELTHRWLKRCVDAFHQTIPLYGHPQSLFPIVQGGMFSDLREQSAVYAVSQNMDGYAIGGLSVGEPADTMYEMTEWVCRFLPEDKPRYLMGVGTPENILECIALGIDMFDCVMPTRNGRNGMLFTPYGIINIKNKKWESDFSPIDAQSDIWVDTAYSKSYLRHLFISNERLASQIASIHNLHFYMWLVREARKQIIAGNFSAWKDQMVKRVMTRL